MLHDPKDINSFIEQVQSDNLPQVDALISEMANAETYIDIFDSQITSRLLDLQSRKLQAQGESFYTIGSAGHEGNAAIAAAFSAEDIAFLHYRGGAFMVQRSKQLPDQHPIRDMLLSFAASSKDPISGGRHKVLGSKALNIPPQTSTIASHLPKAVGAAASIALNKRCKREGALGRNSVALCSFGDASLNHSTAQGAINTASWMAYQKIHLPLVFVCEDNNIGISTPTPLGWVEAQLRGKPAIKYFSCDGLDMRDTYHTALEVESYVRKTRMPAFLHMKCVRLMGHAGSDVEATYLSSADIEMAQAQDPLLKTASILLASNILGQQELLDSYRSKMDEIERVAAEVIKEPKLESAKDVMASIIPPSRQPLSAGNAKVFIEKESVAAVKNPLHMVRLINVALKELMEEHQHMVLAGEDVGAKGGVYGATNKLKAAFGHRVIDTLLDEQTILGLAIGLGHNALLPIVEIQFLAYLHNAEDQLRGEAATLSFFSNGQYTNPMVVRVAGLAYQKGFGGHFHNDNSLAVLRDLPGVIVACPSNGADVVGMLRECVRLAEEEQRVVVFVEPIALYNTRDLHAPEDGLWAASYEDARQRKAIGFGDVAQHGDGKELCIVTYGNGYYLSRQAAKELEEKHRIKLRVIDLRWLHPLPMDGLKEAVAGCEHILIVDECRKTGSPSEELMSLLYEELGSGAKLARLCAEDSFIPLGRAATLTLPSKESIVDAARGLVGK